jgi:ABC-2 type transport system ATP-binding protein
VAPGDVYGYLGPNGAGKTTSLRMLLGLIRPDAGSAKLFGRDPLSEGARALDGVAGFVEAPRFYPYMTGRRNLEMVAALDGAGAAGRIDESLDTVDLLDRAGDKVGGYSHGMRQRLGIAGALLRDPQLLLLDEPTTGLDPGGMRDMRALIKRLAGQGITVLLSSHLMGEVEELCDRVAIIGSGRVLYEGSLPELIASTAGRYEMRTTDDVYAGELASRRADIDDVVVSPAGVTFAAEERVVAELTIALGLAGVGIRELHARTATLEELFFRMTES